MLRDGSAIAGTVIAARGYRTVTDTADLKALGFTPAQCRVPGLLLPLWTTDGRQPVCVYRPDNPRVREVKDRREPDGSHPCRVVKYELPCGVATRLDCPPPCRPLLSDPAVPLWIAEGQKKADSLASHGLCAIALLGVWNWKGKNALHGTTFLNDWDYVALDGRDVIVAFDSDAGSNQDIRSARRRLVEHLQRRRAHVAALYLPPGPKGVKVGVDDYLAAGHTLDELMALVEAPRPAPRPAPPIVKLLDVAPRTLHRPLALLDGRAYAATWLYAEETQTETVDRHGEVVRLDPPRVTRSRRLFVVRDDGIIFGGGADHPLDDLGLDVSLPEVPPVDRLWTTEGVIAYRAARHPEPAVAFERVTAVVDRFIDFDRSLAPQRTMAEMIACYILSTWFLDAFTVVGFLWPTGDRGCGKTQLLTVVTELAYLGQLILSSGSFPTLRDLADYGACLAFDDAEELSDPRSSEPNKRALFLAGNRRGNTVPVKESGPDRTWHTRYVHTFCPRLFSATRLPDPILASRTIVVPLVRTPDRRRANADVLDSALWPHTRENLLADLWALALRHLPELPAYEARVKQQATLTGRALEPWRALLAVGLWLTDQGVDGLWQRLEALSVHYQAERPRLEHTDLNLLVFEALCHCASSASSAGSKDTREWLLPVDRIAEATAQAARDQEADLRPEQITVERVGRVLAKMRLTRVPRPRGRGSRLWKLTFADLDHWAAAYGYALPGGLFPPGAPSDAGDTPEP
jgi:hypothetical protein